MSNLIDVIKAAFLISETMVKKSMLSGRVLIFVYYAV